MRFMLIQSYGGVPEGVPPMSQWPPAAVEAHIAAQIAINDELTERGELVDAQALSTPDAAKFVVAADVASPVVTDGPYPEAKELIAGFALFEVKSKEEAIEWTKRFLKVAGEGESEIRQIFEGGNCTPESEAAEHLQREPVASNL